MIRMIKGLFLFFLALPAYSQVVNDFSLKDVVSGNTFTLSQHQSDKAVVLVFTTNSCPYSKLYESRIADLANRFQSQNFTFVLVNPHANGGEGESSAEMAKKSGTVLAGLPYLDDQSQALSRTLGISKIPHVVVITPNQAGFSLAYQGGIDNNPQLPQSATQTYLEDALKSIAEDKVPNPASTRPVGCNIKAN
jgi:peroxiredoxin